MPEPDATPPGGDDQPGFIRMREDVVVTSAPDPRGGRVYYVKINSTGEVFELGQDEFEIWKQFESGAPLEAAEDAAASHFGEGFRDKLRAFVADLATRGLLIGDFPAGLIEESEHEATGNVRGFLID